MASSDVSIKVNCSNSRGDSLSSGCSDRNEGGTAKNVGVSEKTRSYSNLPPPGRGKIRPDFCFEGSDLCVFVRSGADF